MGKGVTVDISARITGYERSLEQLRTAIAKLDPGSTLARNLTKGLASAESQVKNLSKNLTPKITNDSQLDRLTEKINTAGDSIQQLGLKLQQVSNKDINFDSLGTALKDLERQLKEIETQLTNETSAALKDFINSSEELSKVFKDLDIKIDDKNSIEILDAISKKATETTNTTKKAFTALDKATTNYNQKQARLKSLEASPINNKDEIENNLRGITESYEKAFAEMKNRMTSGLTQNFGVNKEDADKIAASFLGGLTPENIKEKIDELRQKVEIELQHQGRASNFNISQIWSGVFSKNSQMSKTGWSEQTVKTILTNYKMPWSKENFKELQDNFKAEYEKFSSELTEAQQENTLRLLSQGEIQNAFAQTVKDVDNAYKSLQNRITTVKTQLLEATGIKEAAQTNYEAAKGQSDTYTNAEASLRDTIKKLSEENSELKVEKEQLKQEIQNYKDKETNKIKETGQENIKKVGELKIGTAEANQYSDALEKVHQREQLVGKIEGVVQRWFSIYAAVRMVGNAIRSVISTIKELDKTITDITIVTNMSREDLWGQMPQYTKMAQDYAVSISGVYQVSQLFYQQGLQTNDVMTLTAETLKMARIAGLDYAEATNYMTNALRSFKLDMEEASRVTDAYSVLAANAAVSVSEIAEAMSKTASSAYAVGASLENTAAMITVMTEATRESASNIGSALKSIISRYGEMTSDPKKLIDSEGEEMSLNKVDRALQSVGITLQDAQGQFRNFDDVIMELASVWDTLDANTQRYIATVMAGNRWNLLAVSRAA